MDSTLQWLWTLPGHKKLYILGLTILQSIYGASGVLYALILRMVVDSAVGQDGGGFWRAMLYIILLAAAQLALRALIRWLTELSKSTFENIFKLRLTETLMKSDYLKVSAIHSGEWLNRLTNDTVVVANGYVEIIPGFMEMAVKLISALIMIIVLEPKFAIILIPGGVLIMIFTWLFRKSMKRLHKGVQESDGRLRVLLQERLGSLLMVRSFAAEGRVEDEAQSKMQDHQDARMRRNRFSNICNIFFGGAMSGLYLLGVGWCGYGILKGTISFGTLTAITQLISQIQTPFANITSYLPRYYAMIASAERLMEGEKYRDDLKVAMPLKEIKEFYEKDLISIGLDGVSFKYYPVAENLEEYDKSDMPLVLRDLSLDIKKGEIVAFTGHSGCGKSTALVLLMCVYQPDGGLRYFCGKDGLRHELTDDYRRLFAYVPQGNALMNGTIRDVVSFARPEAADDEAKLKEALRVACADEFVSELDDSVDSLLGERGKGLSEGQMQRLAIARAVFSESPILLLDEVTSALDMETEKRLLNNLREMTDRTVVIVTHRPAALEICDRVIEFTEKALADQD